MIVITLHQPWAELFRLREKWVENRTWPTNCRGRMGIHAGKKKMTPGDAARYPHAVYGAIVATGELYACVHISILENWAAGGDAEGDRIRATEQGVRMSLKAGA